MPNQVAIPLAAVSLAMALPAAAQTPPPAEAPALAAVAGQSFQAGAEVLSVDGEPLGVLARTESRPGGERILHIRRTDGSTTTAPAIVAFRGERAVVLEWTRAEFESGGAMAEASPESVPPDL
jgi:hypothetical protein